MKSNFPHKMAVDVNTTPSEAGVMRILSLALSFLFLTMPVFAGNTNATREPDAASNKWNWLAGTRWYVPAENLLAYLSDRSLSRSFPVVDQTLWSLTEAHDGHFRGTSCTEVWVAAPGGLVSIQTTTNTMDGEITEEGNITIVFTPVATDQSQTVGYGHVRIVDNVRRMEMQMATGTDTLAIHWAYMTQLKGNHKLPSVTEQSLDGSLRAEE